MTSLNGDHGMEESTLCPAFLSFSYMTLLQSRSYSIDLLIFLQEISSFEEKTVFKRRLPTSSLLSSIWREKSVNPVIRWVIFGEKNVFENKGVSRESKNSLKNFFFRHNFYF